MKRMEDPRIPEIGTILVANFKGQTISAEVCDGHFLHNGEKFRSLTAIARKYTGYRFSGFKFFGLGKKQPKNDASAISPTDASPNNLEECKEEFSE